MVPRCVLQGFIKLKTSCLMINSWRKMLDEYDSKILEKIQTAPEIWLGDYPILWGFGLFSGGELLDFSAWFKKIYISKNPFPKWDSLIRWYIWHLAGRPRRGVQGMAWWPKVDHPSQRMQMKMANGKDLNPWENNYTLPEANSSLPSAKRPFAPQKERIVFQPSIFRCFCC